MLFNSTEFLVFFALFLAGFAVVRNSLRARNWLLLVASYGFYAAWDYRFTGLLLATSLLDFTLARAIDRSTLPGRRRALVAVSVTINLGVLGLFKYLNFFRESFAALLQAGGWETHWRAWQIILPVGVSFYTFQSISYVVDVYRRQMPASRELVPFLAYVAFFPQLVAGPIERGKHLLPQFTRTLVITRQGVEAGLWLILWGLFKKVALADNLAPLVDLVYRPATTSGPAVVLGTIAFALQIYCDFSGYTDVARGVARLLGFELLLNFNLPYFATSLRDFWNRWHISLSTWIRDYLYFPLGGSRRGTGRTYLNLAVTMLICGLWHGAAVNYVSGGAWHGLGLMVNHGWRSLRPDRAPLPAFLGWGLTAAFVLFGWLLFRAESLDQIIQLTRALADPQLPTWWRPYLGNLVVLALPLVAMQAWQWRTGRLDAPLTLQPWPRAILQGALVVVLIAFWSAEAAPFIYFQF